MSIEEGNRLIADFMGGVYKQHCWSFPGQKGYYPRFQLKYHSSWDWLMPVVERIEEIEIRGMYMVIIEQQYCCIKHVAEGDLLLYETIAQESVSKIDATWQTVIKFVERCNENNSSLQS